MTTSRLLATKGSVAAQTLREQNASFGILSDRDGAAVGASGIRPLPVSGALERIIKGETKRTALLSGVNFIAQKQLEMLHVLAELSAEQRRAEAREREPSPPRTRWWVICDDDSYVIVRRLVRILDLLDDREPILAGGARARAHLCGEGLCLFKNFTSTHGYPPVVHGFGGGPSYAISARGLRLMGKAIRNGHCLDAPQTDLATAACAQVAGVSKMLLPGGWMVNDHSLHVRYIKEYAPTPPPSHACMHAHGT